MKKLLIPAVIAVLFGIGTFVAINSKDDTKTSETNITTNSSEENDIDTSVDACGLLSVEEVTQIVGMNMELGTGNNTTTSDTATVSSCTYTSVDSSVSDMLVAGLLVRRDENNEGAKSGFDQAFDSMPDAETVDGLGDRAYYSPMTQQMNVLSGRDYIIVTVTGDNSSAKELAHEMAEHVLSHL